MRGFFLRLMSAISNPPSTVKGLTSLDKSLFEKSVVFPHFTIETKCLDKALEHLNDFTLKKFVHFKHIRRIDENTSQIILDPEKLDEQKKTDLQEKLSKITSSVEFGQKEFDLDYSFYKAEDILKAILPDDVKVSGFSQVGHIIHLNLRDHCLPYKQVIGQVLLDKTAQCRTVVNKLDSISNEYRVFDMELLAGEPEYEVTLKEGKFTYKLDFSKTFWNPRLSHEHERIIKKYLKGGAIVYDVCAGVGPFAIPAAKRGARVIANDLNPDCVRYMQVNAKLNKTSLEAVHCLDGSEFVKKVIALDLAARLNDPDDVTMEVHILMNLPALADTFLPSFISLIDSEHNFKRNFPIYVHCYIFVKDAEDPEKEAQIKIEEKFKGYDMDDVIKEVHLVRNVAQNKEMFCVSILLTDQILYGGPLEPIAKKLKLDV